ncbi:MAG: putative 2,3-dihydroxybiphenyl 1,2-dioxygenase [Ilumatobacteraceae bacterium]|nr:putative 2,3-dihydroxybiphenyl 1,2-dioxygenase [Ilumatobacteraceae bacterium]
MTATSSPLIHSLGYLRLRSPNVEAWRTYGADVLGLMPVDVNGALGFRWDHYPYRLVIEEGPTAELVAVGFEVGDDQRLAAVTSVLSAAGIDVHAGSAADAASRLVSGVASFTDPDGLPVELFHGPILDHRPLVTPLVSGFVTGSMGLGHVVLNSDDADAAVAFYRDVLGFHRRNTWYLGSMAMHFLGCNPRHHTLAYAQGLGMPGKLMHFMVEAATIDDVGYAQDRCQDAGIPIAMGLGRHTNDHMISFYSVSPDGSMVEFGWGARQVPEPDEETTYQITKPSFWGHRPIR